VNAARVKYLTACRAENLMPHCLRRVFDLEEAKTISQLHYTRFRQIVHLLFSNFLKILFPKECESIYFAAAIWHVGWKQVAAVSNMTNYSADLP